MNEREIFGAAVEIGDPSNRRVYLERACSGDVRLVEHIERLVGAHQQLGSFLEPATDNSAQPLPGLDAAPQRINETMQLGRCEERIGGQIGPYKLMEQIGEGGMGVVYVAQQDRPMLRKVALKIIKPGMDTKEVIARFEAERQALALMDHPNIAKVLDAGTTKSGLPYFAMELVRGIPITVYCDRKKLGTRDRLRLFVTASQAIQHAHQKGVIHRDVKPSNILVTEHDGTPLAKVIDFGVAKATNQRLTERTIYTRHQQMIGTPLYMSPEQADLSALDVDTRSDIYSLGVVLYELLTGVTPFDQARFRTAADDEMRRIIREEEPPKPSTRISTLGTSAGTVTDLRQSDPKRLRQVLRGELDWIVMKAMEKDRCRRYETANGLAADVDRFLSGETVLACPPSSFYRFRKFARRNRGVLMTATSFGVVLLVAAVVSFLQARAALIESGRARDAELQANLKRDEARRQQKRAEEAEAQAEGEKDTALKQQQRAESVLGLMNQMLSSASLSEGRSKDYTVRQMLDDFSGTLESIEENPEVRSEIWFTIGTVQQSIEEYEQAGRAFDEALMLARQVYADAPLMLATQLFHRVLHLVSGTRESAFLHTREADRLLEEALRLCERAEASAETILGLLACNRMFQHRFEEIEIIADKMIELHKGLPRAGSPFGHFWRGVGVWKQNTDRENEAVADFEKAIPLLYEQLRLDQGSEFAYVTFGVLGETLACRGYVRFEQGQLQAALESFEECSRLNQGASQYATRLSVDPETVHVWTRLRLGQARRARKSLDALLQNCRDANKAFLEAEVLHHLARMSMLDGNAEEAERLLRRGVDVCAAKLGDDDIQTTRAAIWLAQHHELLERSNEAATILERLQPNIQEVVQRSDRNAEWVVRLALAKSHLRSATREDLDESIVLARDALERIPRIGAYFPRYVNTLPPVALAKAQIRLGRTHVAIATLREGLKNRHVMFVYEWLTLEKWLLELLETEGDSAGIEEVLREVLEYRQRMLTSKHPATIRARQRLEKWLRRCAAASETSGNSWEIET